MSSRGAFAEYAAAREDKLAHKPSTLTFEQAAAVPISATTALQGLRLGRIEAGQKVLIIGASGGVGTYAVQLAKSYGTEVTGVCSAAKADLVRSLGADHTIDYATEDFADGSRRYDLILDIAGNTPLRRLRRALNPTGSLVIVGGESKGNLTGGFGRSLRAPLVSLFVRPRLTMLASKEHHADLVPLTELIDAGKLTPSIEATYIARPSARRDAPTRSGHSPRQDLHRHAITGARAVENDRSLASGVTSRADSLGRLRRELHSAEQLGVEGDDDGRQAHQHGTDGGGQGDACPGERSGGERDGDDVVAGCPRQVLDHLAVAGS